MLAFYRTTREDAMAMKVTEDCIACGVCEPECPREAISEGEIYTIDADRCTECADEGGPRCVEVCPVDAIAKA
jgi:ferredoxin